MWAVTHLNESMLSASLSSFTRSIWASVRLYVDSPELKTIMHTANILEWFGSSYTHNSGDSNNTQEHAQT